MVHEGSIPSHPFGRIGSLGERKMDNQEIERILAVGDRLTVKELRKALRGVKGNLPVIMRYADSRHIAAERYDPAYNNHRVHGVSNFKGRAVILDSHGSDHIPVRPTRKLPKWAREVIDKMVSRGACSDIYGIMDRVVNEGGTYTRLPSTSLYWKQRRGEWARTNSRPEDWPPVYRRFFWTRDELLHWSRRQRALRKVEQEQEQEREQEEERLQAQRDRELADYLEQERRRRWDLATS